MTPRDALLLAAIANFVGPFVFGVAVAKTISSEVALPSAAVILGASLLGGPVSTAHVVSISVLGVGAAERASQVRWGVLNDIVPAWLMGGEAGGQLGCSRHPNP